MNTRSKGFLILLAILLLAIPTIATLVTPTTYHRGALIYAEFWDFHGEVGARNGSMENVSIENATNVNSSNLNISSKFYVNTSGAIYQGTYNGSPILQDYLDARLLKDSNSSILLDTNKTILTDRNASILVKQRVDSCTGTSDALGWNGTGFDCRTITANTVTTDYAHTSTVQSGNGSGATLRLAKSIMLEASPTNGSYTVGVEACRNDNDGNITIQIGSVYYASQTVTVACNTYQWFSLPLSTEITGGVGIDVYYNNTAAGADKVRIRNMNISYSGSRIFITNVTKIQY